MGLLDFFRSRHDRCEALERNLREQGESWRDKYEELQRFHEERRDAWLTRELDLLNRLAVLSCSGPAYTRVVPQPAPSPPPSTAPSPESTRPNTPPSSIPFALRPPRAMPRSIDPAADLRRPLITPDNTGFSPSAPPGAGDHAAQGAFDPTASAAAAALREE